MPKTIKENSKENNEAIEFEAVKEEEVKIKEDKFTAYEFAKIKNLGIYYEEQFKIVFPENIKKTVNEWIKYLTDTQFVNKNIF